MPRVCGCDVDGCEGDVQGGGRREDDGDAGEDVVHYTDHSGYARDDAWMLMAAATARAMVMLWWCCVGVAA